MGGPFGDRLFSESYGEDGKAEVIPNNPTESGGPIMSFPRGDFRSAGSAVGKFSWSSFSQAALVCAPRQAPPRRAARSLPGSPVAIFQERVARGLRASSALMMASARFCLRCQLECL